MKRRDFFKILPAAAVLSTWTKLPKVSRPRINPAWLTAPYEVEFISPYQGFTFAIDPNPLRFKL